MKTYSEVRAYAVRTGHNKMCAPLAMALVSSESFDDCHEMLAILHHRPHKRTGTRYGGHADGLRQLGYNTKRHGIPHHIKTNITLAGKLDPTKRYIIEYSGHVAAYVNGKIEDWTEGRRYRVRGIVEITETDGCVGQHTIFTMGEI